MRVRSHHRRARRLRRRHDRRRGLRRARTSPTTSRARRCRRCSTPARRKRAFKHLALTHADGKRWLLVGLGARDAFDAERRPRRRRDRRSAARRSSAPRVAVLGAAAQGRRRDRRGVRRGHRARRLPLRRLQVQDGDDDEPRGLEELVVSAHHDVAAPSRSPASPPRRPNAARDLQNAPGQRADADAARRAGARARRRARARRARCSAASRSATPGWAPSPPSRRAADEEPQLITLRYDARGRRRAGRSASSARRSRSTPAASRSSPALRHVAT